jgi:hypothetical protein
MITETTLLYLLVTPWLMILAYGVAVSIYDFCTQERDDDLHDTQ